MEQNSKLTKNEKKVLAALMDDARISDSEIAKRINMTPQGVRKIRKKLEENYISEYRTIINYDSIGITVFAVAQLKVIDRDLLNSKNIIGAFEINEANVTHILILGFASIDEVDDYKLKIAKHADIQKMNIISKKGFLKNSPIELIKFYLK